MRNRGAIGEDLRAGYLAFRDMAPESAGTLAVWARC
jgi:hypothetical protein